MNSGRRAKNHASVTEDFITHDTVRSMSIFTLISRGVYTGSSSLPTHSKRAMRSGLGGLCTGNSFASGEESQV